MEHKANGLCASGITKMIFQEAWEKRDIEKEGPQANAVMIMIDEFQYYINEREDALFTSTSGGSLVCNLYVTQNIDNVIMMMGENSPESRAKSLCGNLSTKIFCANSNYATNRWASDMIGSHFVDTESTTIDGASTKRSYNQSMQPKVPLSHFMTLKTGRKENNYEVEAIGIQTGRTWSNGSNFQELTFSQE